MNRFPALVGLFSRAPIAPLSEVARGREAGVYYSSTHRHRAYKLWESPDKLAPEEVEKFRAFVRIGPSIPGVAWPTDLAIESSNPTRVWGYEMDYWYGGTLTHMIGPECKLPMTIADRVRMASSLSKTLSVLHAFKPTIVVGDLKPDNIAVYRSNRQLRVGILDAGFSFVGFRGESGKLLTSKCAYRTPGYYAPELVENPSLDSTQATDLFSFAVVLFELLFGFHPGVCSFKAASSDWLLDSVKRRYFTPFSRSRDEWPRYVVDPESEDVPDDIRELFRASLYCAPFDRAPATRWVKNLDAWLRKLEASPEHPVLPPVKPLVAPPEPPKPLPTPPRWYHRLLPFLKGESHVKRTQKILIRLTAEERELLDGKLPDGAELAVFAREMLLKGLGESVTEDDKMRRAWVTMLAALSDTITEDEANEVYETRVLGKVVVS